MKYSRPILWGGTTAVVLICIFLAACEKENEVETIQFPSTSVLSIGSSWGVVTSNYLRMRLTPSKSAKVLDGLTKGTVIKILTSTEREETIENETSHWYKVDLDGFRGWVFGAYLANFDSKKKAQAHSVEIK